MSTDTAVSTKVVTGVVRLSYANIWTPKAMEGQTELKYSTAIIISKDDKATIDKINKVVNDLCAGVKAKNKGKLPPKFKLPLRDGDEEKDDENYANCFFLNASSKNKPGIVDRELNEIIEKEEVYSGCYCKVAINFYAFDKNGNRGIAAGLNNIMKVKDGEALSGGSSAKDDFADETDVDDQDDWG